jgi:luciferase family oxidoreductase group 1
MTLSFRRPNADVSKFKWVKEQSNYSPKQLQLGILDGGLVLDGKTHAEVARETLYFASLADSLGYSRYWLTEHHENCYAWASPETLLPIIADRTQKIRVGTAGILLFFYSPLKVAETFRAMEMLYPGRIDLGLAAGTPGDKEAMQALYCGSEPIDMKDFKALYEKQVRSLIPYLTNSFPEGHRFEKGATPTISETPQIWLLGTGTGNMRLAASQGTAFSYSLYHGASQQDPSVLAEYRDTFQPSELLQKPLCNVTLAVVCAEKEAQAKRQKSLFEYSITDVKTSVVGTPEQCQEQILEIQYQYQVDEIILLSPWHLFEERKRSYEMLAEVLKIGV